MPPKRKVSEGEDSSSSRVVDEFGSTDPLVAVEWIKALEVIFDHLKYEDKDRVSCAVFIIVKAACIWWNATKVGVDVTALKWQDFTNLFYNKYFPDAIQAWKVTEFLELRQGSMNVDEYILKFEEGCLFAPYIASNDKDNGAHFIRALRAAIRRDINMSKAVTFKEIVAKALLMLYFLLGMCYARRLLCMRVLFKLMSEWFMPI
ncbi:uncharacterized protein [Primulina eburnea]|uniref:uncharacterized protein n=1 Tax=Primulina eburnea TaxID=1245227 RepID=UPI003C6C3E9B